MTDDTLSWPAAGAEERAWTSTFNADQLTRAQRERIRQPYFAATTSEIADLPIAVPSDAAAEADEATLLLARFDSDAGPGGLPFAPVLLRTESASSSEIEQVTSGARAIAEAELGERATGNAAQIVGNVKSMTAALALADSVDAQSIIAMHTALLGETSPALTGGWREEQVWIGGGSLSPHLADFVPPHAERVGAAMSDLVAFIRRTDVPSLIHVAIAHAQFETIHPFPDGNGRTGRALVHAMLRRSGVTTNVTVPVSAGLLHDIEDYYRALDAYRRGDVVPIIAAFSRAAGYAVANGRQLLADLNTVQSEWETLMRGLRSDAAGRKLAILAMSHPVLNTESASALLEVPPVTAIRALAALTDRGVLRTANSQRRNRIWLADPVLNALDDFAARAGRRRVPQR